MPTGSVLGILFLIAAIGQSPWSGRIVDEAGKPIQGASVLVHSARPRLDPPTISPLIFREFPPIAQTNEMGRFSLAPISPGFSHRLVAWAPGKKASLTDWIGPDQTDLAVTLANLDPNLPKDRIIRGIVVDENYKPIPGALIDLAGVVLPTGGVRWTTVPGVDEIAVTDEKGSFALTSQAPRTAMVVDIHANGFGSIPKKEIPADGTVATIRLRPGSTLSGSMMFEGKPAGGRAIGIIQENQSFGVYVGRSATISDEKGRFRFSNLLPNEKYILYAINFPDQIAATFQSVKLTTKDSGVNKDIEPLIMDSGITLGGVVRFPMGAAKPRYPKIRATRHATADWIEVPLGAKDDFSIPGLTPETYRITVNAHGFVLDDSQISFQLLKESEFGIRLRKKAAPRLEIVVPLMKKEEPSPSP